MNSEVEIRLDYPQRRSRQCSQCRNCCLKRKPNENRCPVPELPSFYFSSPALPVGCGPDESQDRYVTDPQRVKPQNMSSDYTPHQNMTARLRISSKAVVRGIARLPDIVTHEVPIGLLPTGYAYLLSSTILESNRPSVH